MDELFTIPESKSPRLQWMEQHGITVDFYPELQIDGWTAKHNGKNIASGPSEEWACHYAAKRLGIKLWNQP